MSVNIDENQALIPGVKVVQLETPALEGPITFEAYRAFTTSTAIYPPGNGISYTALGLAGEAGEVANKVKKILRGDYEVEAMRESLKQELGDVLWYLDQCARMAGLSLDEVARANMEKLKDRQRRGTIQGQGDER